MTPASELGPSTRVDRADHRLAADLATEAGELLLALRRRLAGEGAPQAVLRSQGDRVAHEHLLRRLAQERPSDTVLSEEGADDRAAQTPRLDTERVWIVDPLDGTREFAEPDRQDWAVHVALVRGGLPVAGAVALPAAGIVMSTADPPRLSPSTERPLRLAVSRSRASAVVMQAASRLGARIVEMGSAGAKAMAVVRGDCEVYAHSGGQYEWDSCAPVAVAQAAGCHASRIDGSALRYNQPDVYLPDLLVCRPELAGTVLEALAGSQA